MSKVEIIVVGGGHAGIEAAHAAARLGVETLLLTMDATAVGRMSCNPAMGGLGKGHVVREIDALGGMMARATDANGLQFRLLNRSRGPAVQAPRVQCDKDAYSAWMSAFLARTPHLTVRSGMVAEILTEGGRIRGITTDDGSTLPCRALVLTTGTFLDSIMHCGEEQTAGGRLGEPSANRLSASFLALGLETGRLKTGTPCRLWKESIDFARTEAQPGDDPPVPMSYRTRALAVDQLSCHLTRTTTRTHEIIRENISRSPMFSGQIQSVGPRYCPSIEDKVVRFSDKESHQIFLEPETRHGRTIYPNGISTSLPADVQEAFVRSIPGLENAQFARYGYAVEYTYVPPHQLRPTLEVKTVGGLYLAGQINGTSGYEEAGGQGIVAGINAALAVRDREPMLLRRDEAYIAVMIDDLLTKEHREPYRLFTSRAEHRLLLRADNADLRLAGHARRVGMITDSEADEVRTLGENVRSRVEYFQANTFRTSEVEWDAPDLPPGIERPLKSMSLAQYLTRPNVTAEALLKVLPHLRHEDDSPRLWELVENEIRYEGYLKREVQFAERTREAELRALPDDLEFERIPSLRREAAMVLRKFRPATLGAAGRLAGVNPSDVAMLMGELRRRG